MHTHIPPQSPKIKVNLTQPASHRTTQHPSHPPSDRTQHLSPKYILTTAAYPLPHGEK
ncbi:hypothetical protein M440DRAFT_1401223 [Trichoderma longibrachiatum ATCC 18648]|uniref:Uncharacterized protein n=1 Tax=Trichoderma longibrachiatum ATCC 18648 TaxID=983965 RepID=A0A2T4C5P5_TRILO|nr:hypothetical protein M440DRAFT_1401223 [Trichoderma longibrachiatum ATCC 18648]